MSERLNPLNSIMFSCLFKDMESKTAMLELINAVLSEVGEEPVRGYSRHQERILPDC